MHFVFSIQLSSSVASVHQWLRPRCWLKLSSRRSEMWQRRVGRETSPTSPHHSASSRTKLLVLILPSRDCQAAVIHDQVTGDAESSLDKYQRDQMLGYTLMTPCVTSDPSTASQTLQTSWCWAWFSCRHNWRWRTPAVLRTPWRSRPQDKYQELSCRKSLAEN